MREPSSYRVAAIGIGSTGARISRASQVTAVSARRVRTGRSYRGPQGPRYESGLLESRRRRVAVGRGLRFRDLVTRLGAGAYIRFVYADEDATEAAVALRIVRGIAERVLAREFLRDGTVDAGKLGDIRREKRTGAGLL